MKIKFIKEYVSVDPSTNSGIIHRFGDTEEIEDYTAQWLIDNGFAEKVEQEWPALGDQHWYVGCDGDVLSNRWNRSSDHGVKAIGNVFKTEKSAQRFVDYLKAVETVRHDEGFMKPRRKIGLASYGYAICYNWWDKNPNNEIEDSVNYAGKFYFDTIEHAEASIKEHESEWQTILDYDWSKE